jgi:pilus assembly protein Flp/PilA
MALLTAFIWHYFDSDDEKGQTLVEYALLLVFIALIVIVALIFLGPIVSGVFQDMGDSLADT